MTAREHDYAATLRWTGRHVAPTTSYASYSREWEVDFSGKPSLRGTADPLFRGDASLYNPEDLLLASLSACHFLSYLALASRKGVVVVDYEDAARGKMIFERGGGRFVSVTLQPRVTVAKNTDVALAAALHEGAHESCFIAASVNFPVTHQATIVVLAD